MSLNFASFSWIRAIIRITISNYSYYSSPRFSDLFRQLVISIPFVETPIFIIIITYERIWGPTSIMILSSQDSFIFCLNNSFVLLCSSGKTGVCLLAYLFWKICLFFKATRASSTLKLDFNCFGWDSKRSPNFWANSYSTGYAMYFVVVFCSLIIQYIYIYISPSSEAFEREFFIVCTIILISHFVLGKWRDVIWCLIHHSWKIYSSNQN